LRCGAAVEALLLRVISSLCFFDRGVSSLFNDENMHREKSALLEGPDVDDVIFLEGALPDEGPIRF